MKLEDSKYRDAGKNAPPSIEFLCVGGTNKANIIDGSRETEFHQFQSLGH